jgi:hypothetical protein
MGIHSRWPVPKTDSNQSNPLGTGKSHLDEHNCCKLAVACRTIYVISTCWLETTYEEQKLGSPSFSTYLDTPVLA